MTESIVARISRGGQIGVNAAAKRALAHVSPESRRLARDIDALEAAGRKLPEEKQR